MDLDYAITHIGEIPENDLKKLLTELKQYRKTYGQIDYRKYITVTKSNNATERIYIDDIIRCTINNGVYEGTEYHTEIYCINKTYYVIDTVDEIAAKIEDANR